MVMRTALNASGGISRKADLITMKFVPQMQTTTQSSMLAVRLGSLSTTAIIAQIYMR